MPKRKGMTPAEIGARLARGKPPLRVSELAAIAGCSVSFIQKLMDTKMLSFVTLPAVGPRGPERRVPVEASGRFLAQLRVDFEQKNNP